MIRSPPLILISSFWIILLPNKLLNTLPDITFVLPTITMYKPATKFYFKADTDPTEVEAAPAGQQMAVHSPMQQDEQPAPGDPSPPNNAESAPPSPHATQSSSTSQTMATVMEVTSTSQEMLSSEGTLVDATSDEEMMPVPPPQHQA